VSSKERKIREFLNEEINGKHGMSERRYAAEFVLDSLSDTDNPQIEKDIGSWAVQMARSLEGFCGDLAKQLAKIK